MLWRSIAVLTAVATTACPALLTQNSPDIPRMVLKPVGAVELQLVAGGFYGPPLCDAEGNLYWRIDTSLRVDKNPVWKISPAGKKLVEFVAPADTDDAGREFRLGQFAVSGGGDFYALTYDGNATDVDYSLVRYASDGEVSSRTHLRLPEHFLADTLGVFATGDVLISGHFSKGAAPALQNQPRIFVLKSDGSPAGEVKLTGEAAAKFEEPSPPQKGNAPGGRALPQNSVSMGTDGNAYVLRGPTVLVISSGRQLVQAIPMPPPDTGFRATRVEFSYGALSVTFERLDKQGKIEVMFRTFDASTGVVQAEYVPGPELSKVPLCFNAAEGYTFLGKKDGRPALLRAWVH